MFIITQLRCIPTKYRVPVPFSVTATHLSVRTNLFEDLPDLWLETHVQHPVRLVQHHVGHAKKRIRG